MEPLGGGYGFASAGDVEPSFLEQGNQRGEHLERRQVDVLDDHPPATRHGLGQRAGLPLELAGRRADDVGTEQRFRIRLRVQVQGDKVVVSSQRGNLLQHRALTSTRGSLQQQRFIPAQRQGYRAKVTPGASGGNHGAAAPVAHGGAPVVGTAPPANLHPADAHVAGRGG